MDDNKIVRTDHRTLHSFFLLHHHEITCVGCCNIFFSSNSTGYLISLACRLTRIEMRYLYLIYFGCVKQQTIFHQILIRFFGRWYLCDVCCWRYSTIYYWNFWWFAVHFQSLYIAQIFWFCPCIVITQTIAVECLYALPFVKEIPIDKMKE